MKEQSTKPNRITLRTIVVVVVVIMVVRFAVAFVKGKGFVDAAGISAVAATIAFGVYFLVSLFRKA